MIFQSHPQLPLKARGAPKKPTYIPRIPKEPTGIPREPKGRQSNAQKSPLGRIWKSLGRVWDRARASSALEARAHAL